MVRHGWAGLGMARTFISCFDTATTVGVCDGLLNGKPRMWSWDLRLAGPSRPDRLFMLSEHMAAYFRQNKVDYVFYEHPLALAVLMEIGASEETIQLLRGVVTVIEVEASRANVPVGSWRVQEARKAVTGHATFTKGKAKSEVLKYCQMLGYKPDGDDQADALVGWLYECSRLNPRMQAALTPLFGGGHAR